MRLLDRLERLEGRVGTVVDEARVIEHFLPSVWKRDGETDEEAVNRYLAEVWGQKDGVRSHWARWAAGRSPSQVKEDAEAFHRRMQYLVEGSQDSPRIDLPEGFFTADYWQDREPEGLVDAMIRYRVLGEAYVAARP